MVEEVAELNGKIKEGFTEVKEELGSMIKFSYADLEKRINALEARIKALEKMVFP
jgi:polyhydroxyalkanoate synthesis regulator phasin